MVGGWELLTEKHYWEGRGGFVFHVRFIKIKRELKLCPTCRFCGKKRHRTTYVLPLSCLSMETLSQVIPAVTQDFNFTIFLKKREQKITGVVKGEKQNNCTLTPRMTDPKVGASPSRGFRKHTVCQNKKIRGNAIGMGEKVSPCVCVYFLLEGGWVGKMFVTGGGLIQVPPGFFDLN